MNAARTHTHPRLFATLTSACVAMSSYLLTGCVEEKVIYNRPMLGGLPNAETGQTITPPRGFGTGTFGAGLEPQTIGTDGKPKTGADTLIIEKDRKRLILSRTGRELMIHIYRTLEKEDRQLFVDEVLSERTRAECYQRGVQPTVLFDGLLEVADEVVELFNSMPQGEATPGVLLNPIGGGIFRLEVAPRRVKDSRFQGFDMVMERGQWRLKWLIEKAK